MILLLAATVKEKTRFLLHRFVTMTVNVAVEELQVPVTGTWFPSVVDEVKVIDDTDAPVNPGNVRCIEFPGSRSEFRSMETIIDVGVVTSRG